MTDKNMNLYLLNLCSDTKLVIQKSAEAIVLEGGRAERKESINFVIS